MSKPFFAASHETALNAKSALNALQVTHSFLLLIKAKYLTLYCIAIKNAVHEESGISYSFATLFSLFHSNIVRIVIDRLYHIFALMVSKNNDKIKMPFWY